MSLFNNVRGGPRIGSLERKDNRNSFVMAAFLFIVFVFFFSLFPRQSVNLRFTNLSVPLLLLLSCPPRVKLRGGTPPSHPSCCQNRSFAILVVSFDMRPIMHRSSSTSSITLTNISPPRFQKAPSVTATVLLCDTKRQEGN